MSLESSRRHRLVALVCATAWTLAVSACGDSNQDPGQKGASGSGGTQAGPAGQGGVEDGEGGGQGGVQDGEGGGQGGVQDGEGGAAGADSIAGAGGSGVGAGGANAGAPGAGGEAGAPGACSRPEACSNPEPAYCECAEEAGGCVVRAKDADGDQHGDARCLADAEADDCDDGHATAYPGADEVCDGFDNDCDDQTDLDDGLSLYGQARLVLPMARDAKIAWSPTSRAYGVLYKEAPAPFPEVQLHTFFALLNPAGESSGTPLRVSVDSLDVDNADALVLAWGDTEFGTVYYQQTGTSPDLYFQRIGAWGGLLGARVPLSSGGFVVRAALAKAVGGDWFVFWEANQAVQGAQISADGSYLGGTQVSHEGATANGLSSARSGAEVVVAYLDSSTATAYMKRVTTLLPGTSEIEVSPANEAVFSSPLVGGTASAYGFAWNTSSGIRFREFSRMGTPNCDAVDLPSPANTANPIGIVSHGEGWLVSLFERTPFSAYGEQRLLRVGPDCEARGGILALETEPQGAADVPQIAGGALGYAAIWGYNSNNEVHSRIRVFGPNLCDAPGEP